MSESTNGLPPSAQPWGRTVDSRISRAFRILGLQEGDSKGTPTPDKTVTKANNSFFSGVTGLEGIQPTNRDFQVAYTSTTGLFEVTVSLGGLVRDGARIGVGFTSGEYPPLVNNGVVRDGVQFSAPEGQVNFIPFSASYSTVVSGRIGTHYLDLFLWVDTTFATNSAVYAEQASITVKAV